ncbi:unnamed protein product [Porites lobata]|uniref:Uncharacterized protein n=1 Tax=Porites lobata TaxID=104759 RepID=A0ABN8NBB1_9CNID|nr:unnamed protein product [Porites lobata]
MGSGASRQNRVEAISDSATLSNPGHPTFRSVRWPERDRAPNIIPVSQRLSLPGSFRPHEVQPNTNYRIWSLFSKQGDGLVRIDPTDNNVDCKGAFSDTTVVMSTSAFNQSYISLLFKNLEKQYVLTAQEDSNGNIKIKAVQPSSGSTYPDQAQFVPHYYWSYTFFQTKLYNQKYLSSDSTGKMTLVDIAERDYPNPQALFILNKV